MKQNEKDEKKDYGSKHSSKRAVNPEATREVRSRVKSGELYCAAAFAAAKKLGLPPEEIGFTADRLELPITHCQLGLHGWGSEGKRVQRAEEVSEELEAAIRSRLDNGKLSCLAAWEIARDLGIGKMAVASACEALEIKIKDCQLGTF